MFIPLPITHNSPLVNVFLANIFDLKIEPSSGSYKRTIKKNSEYHKDSDLPFYIKDIF